MNVLKKIEEIRTHIKTKEKQGVVAEAIGITESQLSFFLNHTADIFNKLENWYENKDKNKKSNT